MSQVRRWRLSRVNPSSAVCVALAALLASGSCGGGSDSASQDEAAEPAVVWRDTRVDGVSRRYRVFTPPVLDDDRPVPLVVALHGSENTVESFVDASELDDAASANSFVVAYPEGRNLLWNGGFCCTSGRGSSLTDLKFLEQVIAELSAGSRIDKNRVYAVGVSGGGVMAYRLGCDRTGLLAGVASVSGSMTLDDCQPSRPLSVIEIHGTADGIVPYAGGRIQGGATAPAPPAPAVTERWASLNRCTEPATSRADGVVTTETWTGCADRSRVRLVTVEGGGHNWFSTVYGPPNGAVDATDAIVQFFELGGPR